MKAKFGFIWGRGIYGKTPDHLRAALERDLDVAFAEQGVQPDDVRHFNMLYPWTSALKATKRSHLQRESTRLASQILRAFTTCENVAIVGHSAFGLITYHLPWVYNDRPINAHLLHPAADSEDIWSSSRFKEVNIFHCYEDKALLMGSKIPFHKFGQLGKYGYEGPREPKPKIFSYQVPYLEPGWKHHDDWMRGKNTKVFANVVVNSELNNAAAA